MIVALAGGVGGAKLAHGLYRNLPADQLTVIVNTADDFDLFGLRISPDADTVMYTLGDLANPTTGWGILGDTFETLGMLARYGRDPWFKVGDRDFGTHLARSEGLRQGQTLTTVTANLVSGLGIHATILPMCDEPVATMVVTPDGTLEFQEYFVHRHHADAVTAVTFEGVDAARVTPTLKAAIETASAFIFCPSNPIVSVGPILAVPGLRDLLAHRKAPKVAVSPIIGGQALKGPADRMLLGLGHEVSAYGVASLYHGLIDGMVIDEIDAQLGSQIEDLGMQVLIAPTIMTNVADRERLASDIVRFCDRIGR